MSSYNNKNYKYAPYDTSLDTNTTFVQADPSNFRAVVQRLTGSSSVSTPSFETGSRRGTGSFKLHERRQQQGAMRKLEMIKLNNSNNYQYNGPSNGPLNGPINEFVRPKRGNNNNDMVSPISTLDGLGLEIGSPSPKNNSYLHGIYSSMNVTSEEKERAIIVEKGFYLHNNNNNNNNRNFHEPKLLPLFPLHSPRD